MKFGTQVEKYYIKLVNYYINMLTSAENWKSAKQVFFKKMMMLSKNMLLSEIVGWHKEYMFRVWSQWRTRKS